MGRGDSNYLLRPRSVPSEPALGMHTRVAAPSGRPPHIVFVI
jgi:hypothetical protein